jgi:hypothetical protein
VAEDYGRPTGPAGEQGFYVTREELIQLVEEVVRSKGG